MTSSNNKTYQGVLPFSWIDSNISRFLFINKDFSICKTDSTWIRIDTIKPNVKRDSNLILIYTLSLSLSFFPFSVSQDIFILVNLKFIPVMIALLVQHSVESPFLLWYWLLNICNIDRMFSLLYIKLFYSHENNYLK